MRRCGLRHGRTTWRGRCVFCGRKLWGPARRNLLSRGEYAERRRARKIGAGL